MVSLLRLCLAALAVVLLAAGPASGAAKKRPSKPVKCPAGATAPVTLPSLCVKLGPGPTSLPAKGLPKRHAALARRARAAEPRLRPVLERARLLVEDGSLRRRAAEKTRGKARAAGLGGHDAVQLGELDPKYANVDAVMSGRQFETTEGRVGGGAATDVDVRDKKGASAGMGIDDYGEVDRCPSATGVVRGDAVWAGRRRAGVVTGGRRVNLEYEFRYEGRYTGHVGRSAKVETLDWAGTGSARVRIWEEDPKTGRLLKHHPTRTFRASLTITGWPVGREPDAEVLRRMQLRGPGGSSYHGDFEAHGLRSAAMYAAIGLSDAAGKLRSGDKRWHDDMLCAKADLRPDREAVRAGDSVRFAGLSTAADGAPSDADWTATTDCPGRLDPVTARGADVAFAIDDSGREWKEGKGPCLAVEVLGPAGRARAGRSVSSPVERFRITFTGQGTHTRDFEGAGGEIANHQVDTFSWRIVFDDVRIDGAPYGNVTATDVSGRFDYGGHFGTATFGCSGDLKAYSGEGVAPLGSILTAPAGETTTLKLSAFSRIDAQGSGCAAETLVNVAPDGGPGPYGVTLAFDPRAFWVEDRRRVGGKATFPPDCGEPPSPGFSCSEEGEWSGEVVIEAVE